MSDERLLERIRNLENNPETRTERSLSRKINSIIAHLQNLLNTHQGSVLIANDYGIPDITNSHGEGITELTRRIERTLQQTILKYEPRLTNVRVKLLSEKDDVLNMRFKLEAVLVHDNSIPVILETVVSADGKVEISE
ncbi:MAG: type VI secretion system baseplate subunit TssE [Candidatus Latescibacteria bacterium]|nr:type VI secretion system baseplate subunit TssE [Candidatus Latescibacterota bacterium]